MPPKGKKIIPKRTYEFKPFDWSRIRYDSSIGIFGQRGGGKSVFSLNVMKNSRLPRCFVICESPEVHNKYSNIPHPFRHEMFDENFLISFLASQNRISKELNREFKSIIVRMKKELEKRQDEEWTKLGEQLKHKAKEEKWTDEDVERSIERYKRRFKQKCEDEIRQLKQILRKKWDDMRKPYAVDIYLDDCSSDNSVMSSKYTKILINNGRHFICRITIMIQYQMDFPAKLRGGLDWLIIFHEANQKNVKRYYEYYASSFSSLEEFVKILEKMTKRNGDKRGCMVIDMRSTEDLEKRVFFCYPEDLEFDDIEIGTEKYKLWAKLYGVETEEDEVTGGTNTKIVDDDSDHDTDRLPTNITDWTNTVIGDVQQKIQQEAEARKKREEKKSVQDNKLSVDMDVA